MTAPTPPATAAEYRDAQRAEYGTYVALVAIDIDGARAFNPGDAVPVSHVERGVVSTEEVAKVTTKAGREAAGITDENKKG
jgi:hypothetical protein